MILRAALRQIAGGACARFGRQRCTYERSVGRRTGHSPTALRRHPGGPRASVARARAGGAVGTLRAEGGGRLASQVVESRTAPDSPYKG